MSKLNVRDGRKRPRYAMIWQADLDTDTVRGLTGSAFRVWVALSSFANQGRGKVWPTRRTLADLLGLARRTVQKSLAELIGAGLVARDEEQPLRLELRSAPEEVGGGAPQVTGGWPGGGGGGVPHRAPKQNR